MKPSRIALDLSGWLLWLLGLWLLWRELYAPLGVYDEGIVLTDAWLLLQGQFPYRDFYSNYPPGSFMLVAALFKVFGASVATERGLGFVVRALAGLYAGRLSGLLAGRPFFAPAAGFVTFWLSSLGTVPFAYVLAIHTALLALLLLHHAWQRGTRGAWVAAGVVLGLVSWMRSDLFGLFMAPVLLGVAAWAVKTRAWRREARASWQGWAPWLALGLAIAIVPFWGALFAVAGGQVLHDLAIDQSRYVLPARGLPMPTLSGFKTMEGLPFEVPRVVAFFEGAVLLTFLGPVLAALAVIFPGKQGRAGRVAAAVLGALALGVVPQMLGRTDQYHAVYTVTPALVLLGAWVARVDSKPAWNLVWAAFCAFVVFYNWREFSRSAPPGPRDQPGFERASGREVYFMQARQDVQRFVNENSLPGEPIYVGLVNHGFVFISEMDQYFLYQRPGGTRYMQFDPNVVNRLDVQQRMAEELRERNVRVVILSALFARSSEPNDSRNEGAHFLDEYLRANYHVAKVASPYMMLLRNE